jgi:uncharacterized membrane protein
MALVQQMAEGGWIDAERAAVVVRDQEGRASYRTTIPVPGAEAGSVAGGLWGSVLGMVIGAIFTPATGGASVVLPSALAGATVGWVVGATSGAIAAESDKQDFDASFTSQVELMLQPGTSALVVLVDSYRTDTEEVLRRLGPLGGNVLRTNLGPEAEARLRQALQPSA